MSKLASLLLAMPDQPGGLILVDEIENGFYHRPTSDDLEGAFCSLQNCTNVSFLFRTHSAECLESAAALAQEKSERFFQSFGTVLEDGETKVRQFDGDKFVEALEETN